MADELFALVPRTDASAIESYPASFLRKRRKTDLHDHLFLSSCPAEKEKRKDRRERGQRGEKKERRGIVEREGLKMDERKERKRKRGVKRF
jgi:hypothetical protein